MSQRFFVIPVPITMKNRGWKSLRTLFRNSLQVWRRVLNVKCLVVDSLLHYLWSVFYVNFNQLNNFDQITSGLQQNYRVYNGNNNVSRQSDSTSFSNMSRVFTGEISMKLWMSSMQFNISGSVEEGSATSSGNSTNQWRTFKSRILCRTSFGLLANRFWWYRLLNNIWHDFGLI